MIEQLIASLDFKKGAGLLPTIVADADDARPRALAYSNEQSLRAALRLGRGIYWSRSRQTLWCKGSTSGNIQQLVDVRADCDRDAIMFLIRQRGVTCHTGAERCFGSLPFSWTDLAARIQERSYSTDRTSYTYRLLQDRELLQSKLLEEAAEVAEAQTPHNVTWECADLLYFMTVKMQQSGVSITDVMAELQARAQ